MGIDNIMFPVLINPGKNLLQPLHNLAEAFAREGGKVTQIWVSREIYDMLTYEITARDRFLSDGKTIEDSRWDNGLITIYTICGEIKIRREE